ncbi:MAG: TolC family protein, partial [Gammaproteobacteria bacterium]|nr:TolC family protein [Gammaproteobacteria bacterium]
NLVFQAIRLNSNHKPVPARPQALKLNIDFEKSYQEFVDISRTYQILRLLEDKSTLEVKKTADELLPSTNLLLGYQLDGQQWGLKEKENSFFAGISLDWPIQRSSEKAQNKIAEIKHKKTLLSNLNKYEELRTNLLNLHLQIEREQKLMDIAQEKIDLAQAILKDETENYSFGKVSLNDYIDAVNDVDENRFSFTEHSVKLNKLLVEWKRLTDRLVDKPRGEEILLR